MSFRYAEISGKLFKDYFRFWLCDEWSNWEIKRLISLLGTVVYIAVYKATLL